MRIIFYCIGKINFFVDSLRVSKRKQQKRTLKISYTTRLSYLVSPARSAWHVAKPLFLYKIIDKFKETLDKFIKWIVKKFSTWSADDLIRKFEYENNLSINPIEQIEKEVISYENEEDMEW